MIIFGMIENNNVLHDTYTYLAICIYTLSARTFNFVAESLTTDKNSIFFQNKDQLSDVKNQEIVLSLIIT